MHGTTLGKGKRRKNMIEKMLTISVKNKKQPIHWHDLLEINFVIQGELDIVRNNRTFHVQTGEMMVLNRDDIHSVESRSEDLLYIQLHFDLEKYNQYLPEIWTALFYCSPEEDDIISQNLKTEMKGHISRILRLMSEQMRNIDAENKIVYYSIDILSSLKMGFLATIDSNAQRYDEQMKRVWKAIDYIYDNCHRRLTLHEVASQIYVSDDYLTRLLKKSNGMGFEQFVAFVRAELSIKFLLNTDMNISDITFECGFSAPRYYNAAFLKSYGCTPSEYRKNNRKNFRLERQNETMGVILDEDIDLSDVLEKAEKYEIVFSEDEQIREKVDIDFNTVRADIKDMSGIKLPIAKQSSIWHYSVQRFLADIQFPCSKPQEHVFVWKESDALKLLCMNPDAASGRECIIKISGLDPSGTYIYCREKSLNIPDSLRNIMNSGKINILNRDIIDHIFHAAYEYGEISQEEQVYMNIDLNCEQIAKIIIQKIG